MACLLREAPLSVAKFLSLWKRFGRWTIAAVLLVVALGIGYEATDEVRTRGGRQAG